MAAKDRIVVLDGMRGIAVLLVMSFHLLSYFGDWQPTSPYPFGNALADIQPFHAGHIGVILFFVISGFVIAKSLDQSRSASDFALKRIARLCPPMIVIATITFLLLSGPLPTPILPQHWSNFLPSWTFTSPEMWRWVNPDVRYVDGSYWTLFVELRFYIIAAALWFTLPRKWAVRTLAVFGIGAPLVLLGLQAAHLGSLAGAFKAVSAAGSITLFCCGALYLEIYEGRATTLDKALLILCVPMSLVMPVLDAPPQYQIEVLVGCILTHALFASILSGANWVNIFRIAPLMFLGQCSYSLYLLHQGIGIGMLSRIPKDTPAVLQAVLTVLVFAVLICTARLSYHYLERMRLFRKSKKPGAGTEKLTVPRTLEAPSLR